MVRKLTGPSFHALLAGIPALLVGTDLAAQSLVLPTRAQFDEGTDADANAWPGFANGRMQQCMAEAKGRQLAIRGLRFRRDSISSGGGLGRTVELELTLGSGDFANFSRRFDNNYVGPGTTVIARRRVSLPDWSRNAPTRPAPFDLVLPLDRTYTHDPRHALIWDVRVTANSHPSGYYPMDRDPGGDLRPPGGGQRITAYSGCQTATSGILGFKINTTLLIRSSTRQAQLVDLATSGAPASSPVTLLVGTSDPALRLPGACGALRSSAELAIPMGTSSSRGHLPWFIQPVGTHQANWSGVRLYVQAVAPDASKPFPIAFSTAREFTLPPLAARPVTALYTRSLTSSQATEGNDPWDGGLVTQLDL